MGKIVTILLVEDDQLDIIDIKKELDKIKILYNIHIARNGEEALEMLKPEDKLKQPLQPDVILIDINMPKMNGLEFLATIRKEEVLKNLKSFIITTSSDQEDKEAAWKLGISGFITKPFKSGNGTMDSFNLMIDLMNIN